MRMVAEPARVEVTDLVKKYGKVVALNGVSFICEKAEFFVVLGPPGAGKTTLLKTIAGLTAPTSGTIKLEGVNIAQIPTYKRDLAMVFENYVLYPHLKVYDNLASPLRSPRRKMRDVEIDQRVKQIAEMLEIEDLLDRKPAQLSGGQRQRVALGRAMVSRASLTLMDEPIAHLDAKLRESLRADLKEWQREVNTTVIYTTHDYTEAMGMADRILVMREGVVQQIGTPKEVYYEPQNVFVAKAIGYPPINIVKGQLQEANGRYLISCEFFRNQLVLERATSVDLTEPIWIGVRPLDLVLLPFSESTASGCMAEVVLLQRMGNQKLVQVCTHTGTILTGLFPAKQRIGYGDRVIVEAPRTFHIFFGPEGKRLEWGEETWQE